MSDYVFTGVGKWAKVRKPDDKYDRFTVDLYLDDDSWETFYDSGIQLEEREDADGKFVRFARKNTDEYGKGGPPKVYLKDTQSGEYHVWKDGLIGNGSKLAVTVETFKGKNGIGHRMLRVFVDQLVEYNPDAEAPDQAALPF